MRTIRRRNNKITTTIVASVCAFAVIAGGIMHFLPANAASLNQKYEFIDTDYAVPSSNVIWVATDGDDGAAGTEVAPMKTAAAAVRKATEGTTIVFKTGVYREPHFFITKKNITFQAAPHAEVWFKGSDIVQSSSWTKDGGVWKTTSNYQNFCHVCTTNKDPSVEGIAAYPEQVFINDEPLVQVATKDEVTAGKFYVEDLTPTTLKVPGDNTKGYNIGAQDEITYYMGSDPTSGTVEISQRARAFSVSGEATGFAMKGINIAQYSQVQAWGFEDPVMGGMSGPLAVSLGGANSVVQDSYFVQNSVQGIGLVSAAGTNAAGTRLENNYFLDNGANGAGVNSSNGTSFIGNTFSGNNAAGFETRGSYCGAYCTVSDIKVTHTENITFRDNKFDYSGSNKEASKAENTRLDTTPGIWCDEGCIGAKIVGNFFTNVPVAIFYEVSDSGIIASNIIESSGTGIEISGSSNVKIYNNTISRTFRPISLREDDRMNGCAKYDKNTGTCLINDPWSQSKGLSWDLTNLEMYNNIISSRAYAANDGSGPYWAYPVRTVGAQNQDDTTIFTNDMFAGFDYNAYYRSNSTNEPTVFTWDLAEMQDPINVLFKSASEISKDTRVSSTIAGRDAHSFDTFGSRIDNPYFVKEATGNADYKQSNYNIKAGSPALLSGTPLPNDVALAIDPTGQTVKAGVAVNRGALTNVLMNAAGTETPISDEENINMPDNNLRTAVNKALSTITGSARTDDQKITKTEIAQLDQLRVNLTSGASDDQKIKDLTGLEHATNLQKLYIDNNAVSTLSPLSGLQKLDTLTAIGNKITSLSPLSTVGSLQTLFVSDNAISDIYPLTSLSKLTEVTVSGNGMNAIIDISALSPSASTLTRFAFYDYGSGARLQNSDQLTNLTHLTNLRLTGVQMSDGDLANIGKVNSLTTLRLDYSNIADLRPLSGLSNLTSANIKDQTVRTTANDEVFPSPLVSVDGSSMGVTDSVQLANDTQNQNSLKVVTPVYDNLPHELSANFDHTITIGGAQAQYSGVVKAMTTLSNPQVSSGEIAQTSGGKVLVNTTGDKCYNIQSLSTVAHPDEYNDYTFREVMALTVDCGKEHFDGYTTNIKFTLTKGYDTSKLKVYKIANGNVVGDITDNVTFGTANGMTTISYDAVDGGQTDDDGQVNGSIVVSIGVYEHQDPVTPPSPDPNPNPNPNPTDPTTPNNPNNPSDPGTPSNPGNTGGGDTNNGSAGSSVVDTVVGSIETLANTGEGLAVVALAVTMLGSGGVVLVRKLRR